jgi:hypothetical protein
MEEAVEDAILTEGEVAEFVLQISEACLDLCLHHPMVGAIKVDIKAEGSSRVRAESQVTGGECSILRQNRLHGFCKGMVRAGLGWIFEHAKATLVVGLHHCQ